MSFWRKILMAGVPLALFTFAGCAETTTEEDVAGARSAYREASQKAEEAKAEGAADAEQKAAAAEEARTKLEKTEADFKAEEARKEFLTGHEEHLATVDTAVKELKDRAGKLEGPQKDQLNEAIGRIEDKCGIARDKLAEVKKAPASEWQTKQEDAEKAMAEVDMEVEKAQAIK
ncbi:MAG: hypothetical protein HYS13_00670 [Planctomycetia bacterium]|nr:hypothetical protein [Planctomycetia bacterium]